ncbi:MAG: hypothetical protein IT462_11950 [Planctomycetes bacterium]|nr:hypothetical protein [Planctomycetota bacterium]
MNVRYQETSGGGKWFWISALAVMAFVGAVMAVALYFSKPWPNWPVLPAVTCTTVFILLLTLSRVSIEVRDDGISARLGVIFRKSFTRDEIERVAVEKYDWKEFGGWGWKMNWRGSSTFSYIGAKGCLRIFLKNGKSFVVTVNNPQAAKDAYDGTTR